MVQTCRERKTQQPVLPEGLEQVSLVFVVCRPSERLVRSINVLRTLDTDYKHRIFKKQVCGGGEMAQQLRFLLFFQRT